MSELPHIAMARLIYDTIFLPGEVVDDYIMPTFDKAAEDETGAYLRSVLAAHELAIHGFVT